MWLAVLLIGSSCRRAILRRARLSAAELHVGASVLLSRGLTIALVVLVFFGLKPAIGRADGPFGFAHLSELARKLAGEEFRAPAPIPDFLKAISYDEYRDIRFDTKQSLWRDGGNFQIQFIHPGLYFAHAVKINTVDEKGVRPVKFSRRQFGYGRNKFADKIPPDLGFAGFRVAFRFGSGKEFNHALVFAGASYFRAVAKGEVFGLSARGLAIDTGLPSGEEFPFFREFWLERPARGARQMRIYALLDSQSAAGAYAFVVRPGEQTVVEVRARLFLRKPVKELGVAPLTSMFFYGKEKPRPAGEWRPEVHDSDGLLIHSQSGEWIWRPLGNPAKLRVSYFELNRPRGFGLLQRERRFQSYEDLETRFDLRPNAWIVPQGDWGSGFVKLVEIPSDREANDNIVAYWLSKNPAPQGKPLEIAYRVYFQSDDPQEGGLARLAAMRAGGGDREEWKRIVLDFEGGKMESLPANAAVKAVIAVGPDGQLVQQSVMKNPVTQGWRLVFQVKPPKGKNLELRAFLQKGNEALSETWSYQLEP